MDRFSMKLISQMLCFHGLSLHVVISVEQPLKVLTSAMLLLTYHRNWLCANMQVGQIL
uniref:Uncharacterized protein n=1 Tax=Aegilops tauschii subsp. strangulata TaxID=200361 RepID=A0A453P648_AEGTS